MQMITAREMEGVTYLDAVLEAIKLENNSVSDAVVDDESKAHQLR